MLQDADEALRPLRLIADACIGAFFSTNTDKARETERIRRLDLVGAWLAKADDAGLPSIPKALRDLEAAPVTFHWMLEFPEVFHGKRPDPLDAEQPNKAAWMDAFVGNPPFMGKNGIAAMGDAYLPWLQAVHEGAHGNADYAAHFFRRAFHLLGDHGTFGLIATNTIAQGDTRATGLKYLVGRGAVIYDAFRSMKWPGAANVAVSVVHVAKGHVGALTLEPRLDRLPMPAINSRLRGKPERPDPVPLKSNEGKSFQGSIVLGMGFVLSPAEREELIGRNKKNAERIFRYIGGEEINSDPSPDLERYVINFGQMDLEEAEKWPELIDRVRRLVKPERDKNKREVRRKYWWRFGEPAPALYLAIRTLNRCIMTSRHSKHLLMSWQLTSVVPSEATIIFPLGTDRHLAALHSRVHEVWARLLSSSMRTDLRYAPSDCFETFPFPSEDAFSALDSFGERLDQQRRKYLDAEQVGLTTTYNRLKDPSQQEARIIDLRDLHEDLDRAVLAAYGWSDIPVPPYCGADPRALETFEDEVLDRLFALNAERARAEAIAGEQLASQSPARVTRRKRK